MAEKKTRKFATWRIKYYLLYIAMLLLFVFGLIATIFFVKDTFLKIVAIVYEGIVILISIALFIVVTVFQRKNKRNIFKKQKNCDIHAK